MEASIYQVQQIFTRVIRDTLVVHYQLLRLGSVAYCILDHYYDEGLEE
jgi:hypothetical protein